MPLARRSWLRRNLNATIARFQRLIGSVYDPYRPERHYMRGPGPKWCARHHTSPDDWPTHPRNAAR